MDQLIPITSADLKNRVGMILIGIATFLQGKRMTVDEDKSGKRVPRHRKLIAWPRYLHGKRIAFVEGNSDKHVPFYWKPIEWWWVPNLDKNQEYQQALEVSKKIFRDDESESSFYLDHAKERLQQQLDSEKALDSKADRLSKFSIAIAGILIAISQTDKLNLSPNLPFLLGCLCFVISSLCDLLAQVPVRRVTVPSIASVQGDSHNIKAKADWLAASYHPIIVGSEIFNSWMGRLITTAHMFLILGLLLVFIATTKVFDQISYF